MEAYIERLLYSKKLNKEQVRLRDLVINSDDEGEPDSQPEPVKEEPSKPIPKSTSNMSMEDFIFNMASHDKVTNSDDEDEPVKEEPAKEEPAKPIPKSTSNMSMEDFIFNMASHDKVTNDDDDEDEPEPVNDVKKEEPPKSASKMSMKDFIFNMASNDKVTNSDDEDADEEPPKSEPIMNEKTEEMKKIEERENRVKNAKIRFEKTIPNIVFVVPYRNRSQQRNFFESHMLKILEDFPDTYYKIYYINQKDNREFNRGAMKNIGFSILKNQYPSYYKDITIVFNDVDVMPYNKDSITYETSTGIVKHFYGFNYALGGILSIKAGDFEKTKGFPNVWDWGYEDIIFKNRVDNAKLTIDYSHFFKFKDGNIIKLNDDVAKLEQRNPTKYNIPRVDGLSTIYDLNYIINEETGIVEVHNFSLEKSSNSVKSSLPTSNQSSSTIRRKGMMF